jgi:hypothetical protein
MCNGSRNRQMYRRELGCGSRVYTDDRSRDSKLLKDSAIEQEYVIASLVLMLVSDICVGRTSHWYKLLKDHIPGPACLTLRQIFIMASSSGLSSPL